MRRADRSASSASRRRTLTRRLVATLAWVRGVQRHGESRRRRGRVVLGVKTGEESDVQIAGTTIHQVGHVLAGNTAGLEFLCFLLRLRVKP